MAVAGARLLWKNSLTDKKEMAEQNFFAVSSSISPSDGNKTNLGLLLQYFPSLKPLMYIQLHSKSEKDADMIFPIKYFGM